jgi:hypothetical protein
LQLPLGKERQVYLSLFLASKEGPKKSTRESEIREYEVILLWSDNSYQNFGKASGRGRLGLKGSEAWQNAELALLYEDKNRTGRILKILIGDDD